MTHGRRTLDALQDLLDIVDNKESALDALLLHKVPLGSFLMRFKTAFGKRPMRESESLCTCLVLRLRAQN